MSDARRNATLPPTGHNVTKPVTHPRRAACKLAAILVFVAALVAALSYLISERDLEILKHSLSLWTLIALVVIINLVSFGCFTAMVAAWQWVRRDLKAPRDDGLDG